MSKYKNKLVQRQQLVKIIAFNLGLARKRVDQVLKMQEELIVKFMMEGRIVSFGDFVTFRARISKKGKNLVNQERLYPDIIPSRALIKRLRDVEIPELARMPFKSILRWHPELREEYENGATE